MVSILVYRLENLEAEIIEHNARLVIVDSIASLIRKEYDSGSGQSMIHRTNLLVRQAALLKYIAQTFNIPVSDWCFLSLSFASMVWSLWTLECRVNTSLFKWVHVLTPLVSVAPYACICELFCWRLWLLWWRSCDVCGQRHCPVWSPGLPHIHINNMNEQLWMKSVFNTVGHYYSHIHDTDW